MKARVSDYIARALEERGVRRVFLVSGGGMMHLLDSASRMRKLKVLSHHHEQAAAMAAEAYARKTGGLGVCYATSGPGATNLLTGLVSAWQDSTPVLFVTGQAKRSETIRATGQTCLRQCGTFEVDIVPIVRPVTKYAVFLEDPARARYELEKACALALSGRPGPVLIDIPLDVQGALIEPERLRGFEDALAPEPSPVVDLEVLRKSKRPLILAGHGVRASGSYGLFRKAIKRLRIPVVTTALAKDLLEYEHPLFVGHPGIKGDRAGNLAVQNADVILAIGTSLHALTTGYELDRFAPRAFKIQVDLDEAVLAREKVGVSRKIVSGVRPFLERLLEGDASSSGVWRHRCLTWKRGLAVIDEPHRRPAEGINYYDFVHELSRACRGGETVVTDAGLAYYVVSQAFRLKARQRLIVCGALGTMGYALPAATGACAADPRGKVVCVTGDGSLQTNIHELAVLRENRLNAAVFIVNNAGYVSIRNTQSAYFSGRLTGTGPESGVFLPELKRVAAAYGLPYLAARRRGELKAAITRALEARGPVLCEIFSLANQEVIPSVRSERLPDGTMRSKPLDEMYPYR